MAVIVLSFLGFGPLKSFFYDRSHSDGTRMPIIERVKDQNETDAIQTFLIVEQDQSLYNEAAFIKYNRSEKTMHVGSLKVPNRGELENQTTFLKKYIDETYNEKLNHLVVLDTQRIAKTIDKALPNGIHFVTENNEHGGPATYRGEDIISLITGIQANPDSSQNLMPIFMQFKEELLKNVSPEEMIAILPEIIGSVQTDMGKGKMMDMGLTLLMDPVTSIQPLELAANKGANRVQHIF